MFFTLLKENLIFAVSALWNNRLRTFLSLLGITIGILAIISVFTIVDSLETNLRGSIESLGKNVIFIQKWPWVFNENSPWWKYMSRPVPNYNEAAELKRKIENAEAVSFHVDMRRTIKADNNEIEGVTVSGVSDDFSKIQRFEVANGRYFTDMESGQGNNVCILGHNVALGLFGSFLDPVGSEIHIGGRKVRVIGVFKKEGESIIGNTMDNQVVIPINFIARLADLKNESMNPFIMVKGRPGVSNEQLKDELMGALRGIRRLKPGAEENFSLNEIKLLSSEFDNLFDFVGTVGWIIGGFSILVGGFGIANIMFVSVKERTNLIGVQKALGAKNYSILMQFLSESIILSMVGGLFGLLIVAGIAPLASSWFSMEVSLAPSNIILGITISFLIGIISGFIPAYGASQLDPVEAIRSN